MNNIKENTNEIFIDNIEDNYRYGQDSTTTARVEDIHNLPNKDVEKSKDILMSRSTEEGIIKVTDAMCNVVGSLDTLPSGSKSMLRSFSVEFCDNFGVSKDSVEVVLSSKKSEDERKELLVEVGGVLVKTIAYESQMLPVKEASAAVSGAILAEGGAAHPAGWVMAAVTGGSVYALGHVVATATSEKASKEFKTVLSGMYDNYIRKDVTELLKDDNQLILDSKEQFPEGKIELHLNQNEADIFNKEILEDIGKTLPKDVGLVIQTKDNAQLEITVGNPATKEREAKIFDSKVFNQDDSTQEMKTWIEGVASMGVEKIEVNEKSFELKDANATVLKENLVNIPESSVLLSNVKLYPNDKLAIDDTKTHIVVAGDTFSEVAQSHEMTSKELLEENTWLIDEKRVEFKEEKILVNTSEKNEEKQIDFNTNYELNDENTVSRTGATIIRTYDISKENEILNEQTNTYDPTTKAQEIVDSLNLPEYDNSIDNNNSIDY